MGRSNKRTLAKKASFYTYNWAEFYAILLAFIGFIVSIALAPNKTLNYIVVITSSFMGGRLIYQNRKRGSFTYNLIAMGFYIGFVLGSYYVSRKLIIFLLIASTIVSYYIHGKGYV